MSSTASTLPTPTKAAEARSNDRNNDLMQDHTAAMLVDPDGLPPDPVTVFLPASDAVGREEALVLAITYARDGYDVDLRHVHVSGRKLR